MVSVHLCTSESMELCGHKAGRVSYSMKSTLEKAHFKDTVAKRLDNNM